MAKPRRLRDVTVDVRLPLRTRQGQSLGEVRHTLLVPNVPEGAEDEFVRVPLALVSGQKRYEFSIDVPAAAADRLEYVHRGVTLEPKEREEVIPRFDDNGRISAYLKERY